MQNESEVFHAVEEIDKLGDMPEPMPQLYDIYMDERTPYDVVPATYLYDTNHGVGYTIEEARERLRELKAVMRLPSHTFSMGLRGFDAIPKCKDTNNWGWDDKDVELDPDYKRWQGDEPVKGAGKGGILPRKYPDEPVLSLDELGDIEQELEDFFDPPF